MKIRIQSGGIMHPPQEMTDIDSLVVMTDEGLPIGAALNIDSAVWIRTASEAGFEAVMAEMGFGKSSLPTVDTLRIQ